MGNAYLWLSVVEFRFYGVYPWLVKLFDGKRLSRLLGLGSRIVFFFPSEIDTRKCLEVAWTDGISLGLCCAD